MGFRIQGLGFSLNPKPKPVTPSSSLGAKQRVAEATL